jgi:hypothetical protein
VADRFADVAKLLSDTRLTELVKENRKLKLDIFWSKYNYSELCEAMTDANRKFMGPNCKCGGCSLSRARDGDDPREIVWRHGCLFIPYFEGLLTECGLTTHRDTVPFPKGIPHPHLEGDVNDVLDVDVHLVAVGPLKWEYFFFGSKLWKARSVDSPELLKLVLLFKKLREELGGEADDDDHDDE